MTLFWILMLVLLIVVLNLVHYVGYKYAKRWKDQ